MKEESSSRSRSRSRSCSHSSSSSCSHSRSRRRRRRLLIRTKHLCFYARVCSEKKLYLAISQKSLRKHQRPSVARRTARVKTAQCVSGTWNELFTTVECWIYLCLSWMKGNGLAHTLFIVRRLWNRTAERKYSWHCLQGEIHQVGLCIINMR